MAERVRLLGGVLNIRAVLGKGSMVEVELPYSGRGGSIRRSRSPPTRALSAM
jgi:hypothetical protein